MKIPFLSAKNKKLVTTGIFWFGLVILAAAIFRAFKSPAEGAKAKAMALVADVKEMLRFTLVLLPFTLAVVFYAMGHEGLALLSLLSPIPGAPLLGINLGTLTTGAGVVTTFNTTYVPKWFSYVAATQLTGVKITVQGEGVIFDSDANGLNHCGVNRLFGQVTNGYLFTIANGFIKGKNVIWEFTNSAAQTPVVYVNSDETPAGGNQEPEMYLQLLRQAILANSGMNFDKFATLSLPSLAATDQVNVLNIDGTQQQWLRADLQIALGLTQNIVNTPVYMVDNFDQRTKMVNIIAGAAQTAYVQRWVVATSGGMINQAVNQY